MVEDFISIAKLAEQWPMGTWVYHERDGYAGTVQGYYITREGRPGLVIQQSATKVVHVYHLQWVRLLQMDELDKIKRMREIWEAEDG